MEMRTSSAASPASCRRRAIVEVLRQIYEDRGWAARAWTWHEAADVRQFQPHELPSGRDLDLVWIGNWGEGERALELQKYLIEPVQSLRLRAEVYGVRYPDEGRSALRSDEILVAHDGEEVAALVRDLTDADARRIGAAARERVLAEHTYAQRALQFENALESHCAEGAAA
jgi:spore maturation protein CgeB